MNKQPTCWHCGKPVLETIGASGLCKSCIKKARSDPRTDLQVVKK